MQDDCQRHKKDGKIIMIEAFPWVLVFLSKEGSWADSRVGAAAQGLLSTLSAGDTVGKRELDLGLGELHTIHTPQILGSDSGCSNDLDGSRASTMTTGHFVVQLRDGTCQGDISVFSVHIVCTRSRVITEPDTIVLDNSVVLLHNLYTV